MMWFSFDKSIFKEIIGTPNYWAIARFHALSQLLVLKEELPIEYSENRKKELIRWMRVCKNLINNSTISDPVLFVRAIKSINNLSVYCHNILDYMSRALICTHYTCTYVR